MPAVTELIIAELLYLQYKDRTKPIYLYINSTGTSRADGETVSPGLECNTVMNCMQLLKSCMSVLQVGFETEGTAIFDTMQYVTNEVSLLACNVSPSVSSLLLISQSISTSATSVLMTMSD